MKRIIILCFLVLLSTNLFSQDDNNPNTDKLLGDPIIDTLDLDRNDSSLEFKKAQLLHIYSQRKSPFAASFFSLMYSGTGQFYTGSYTKGSLLFLGETVFYLFYYGLRFKYNEIYGGSVNYYSMQAADQSILVGAFVVYLGLKVYSMFDAYKSAEAINYKLDKKIQKIKFVATPIGVSLSYCIRF